MAHIVRISPQPASIDEAKDSSIRITEDSFFVTDSSMKEHKGQYDVVYPATVDDPSIITQLKMMLVPQIAQRSNVVLLFSGHDSSGKTCLFEQTLPVIVESLKSNIISADEAHQEALNIGIEATGSARRKRNPTGAQATAGAATTKKVATAVVNNEVTSESASPDRKNRRNTNKELSSSSAPKYSLLMARMPRDSVAVELAQVDVRANGSPRQLLPKLQVKQSESSVEVSAIKEERSPSRWRLSMERARSPIQMTAGSVTSLGAKNGRQIGEHYFPCFDGERHLTLEPSSDIDKTLKDPNKILVISFWMMCDGSADNDRQQGVFHFFDAHEANYRVCMMLHTNDLGFHEHGHSLISVRDSHGKKLEATISDDIANGSWHFIEVRIKPSEKQVEVFVDDKSAKMKTHVGDSASAFHDSRPKIAFFGALAELSTDGTKCPCCFFKGSLMDFNISELYSGKKFASYSFRGAETGNKDATFTQPDFSGDVPYELRMFPQTSPSFDGSERFVNIGTVGDLGLMMDGTTFDIVFRTSCTNEKMALMGVVDSVGKHPGFGIELNTNTQMQLQRYMMTFWIQDRSGSQVRVTAELSSAFDDHWHTLSVRIVDLEAQKFKVRLDGRLCDAVVHNTLGPPKDLMAYTQFVTIGAINMRGEVRRFLRGSLKRVTICRTRDDQDEPLADWNLNEGPGAIIAMDSTSHGFNGIYFLKSGTKGAMFFPTDIEGDGASDEVQTVTKGVVRYSNNVVTMALCTIATYIDSSGFVKERVHDLFNNKYFDELEQVPHFGFNSRVCADDKRMFQTIPEDCYVRVVPNDYLQTFRNAMTKVDDSKHSHTVFVLRLGDASFTVMDLASLKKTPKATFSPAQLSWTDAVNMFGNTNKINFAINSSLTKLDKLLLHCGAHPQLYKRSLFLKPSVHCTFDSFIANVASFALLASKEPTQLYMMHLMAPKTRCNEGLHSLLLVERMRREDRVHAAIVIQKLYRWRKAHKRYLERLGMKKEADMRRDRIALLRKQHPKEILEKEKRLALLIFCNDFDYDPSMTSSRAKFDDMTTLPRLFEALGFKCELMLNPSRKNILDGLNRKKQEQLASDAMLYVHFVGVGGLDCYHQEPSIDLQLEWLQENERSQRLAVLSVQRKEMAEYVVDEQYEFNLLVDQIRQAAEELEAKNAKKKKKGGDKNQPQIIVPSRPPKPSKEASIASMQRWDAALAPQCRSAAAPHQQGGEALDRGEGVLFFCTGDTRATNTKDNTVTFDEVRQTILSESPKRGEHVIFSFDVTAFPSPTNKSFGCGGIVASSGETIMAEYKRTQQLLITYYLKRCLQGAAVECARIGKNDPPTHVTMEIACRYIRSKIDPTEGKFPCRSLRIHWFGEFVGEVYVARKVVMKKEERRKLKQSNQGKKMMSRLECSHTVPPKGNDIKQAIQSRLHQLLKSNNEVKKLAVSDRFSILLPGTDFNTLTHHELAKKEVTAALNTAIPGCERLKWFPKKETNGASVEVHPIAAEAPSNDPDASKDQKQQALELYQAQERRLDNIDKKIFAPMSAFSSKGSTLASFAIGGVVCYSAVTLMLPEEECQKLDRFARLGEHPFLPECTLHCCRLMTDKELQEIEQYDRLIAMEEGRRQTEAKLRMVQEAEAKKKADEEMARLLQKKDAIVDKVQQIKGIGVLKPEDAEFVFSVPLLEALCPAMELLAQLLTKDNAEGVVKTSFASKIVAAAAKSPSMVKESRFVSATLKLVTSLAPLVPAVAGQLASFVLPHAVAVAGNTVRFFPPCIDALVKAGAVLDGSALTAVAPLWPSFAVEAKDALTVSLVAIGGRLSDVLSKESVQEFGQQVVSNSVSLERSAMQADDNSFLALLHFTASCGEVTGSMVASFVKCAKATGAIPVADQNAQKALSKLASLTTKWSDDQAKEFLEVFELLDSASKVSPFVDEVIKRLRA